MGGCATKPKVTKDGGVDVKAPEPEPEPEQVTEDSVETKVEAEKQEQLLQSGLNLDVNDIVDDDQANKRRSLSLLFNKENEDAKVSNEETVKEETSETEKPLEDAKSNEPTLEKPSQETKNNEPSTEQESVVVKVDVEEKPSLQNQITDSAAEEIVKTETPEEAKKTSQETSKINEPAEETVVKTETPEAEKASEETKSNELNEPIKLEKSSETIPIENVVVPPPEEKVIEVILTNAESVDNKVVEATSSIEEHISKASDAGSDKASTS